MASNTSVQMFAMPTAYDQQMVEARRRRRMAEALANQAYVPQDVGVAPIPAAAPLVQGLQAFLAARAAKKADEAEERAGAAVARTGEQIAGRLMGGAPVRELSAPDASGLDEVAVTSQYRQSPQDALRLAMTPGGMAAMKGNPLLASMLARTMEKPEAPSVGAVNPSDYTAESVARFSKTGDYGALVPRAKAPTVAGGMAFNEQTGKFEPIAGYAEQQGEIAEARRPQVIVTGGGASEPLVTVKGPDGNPMFVPRSQAAGMPPWTPRTAAQEVAEVERGRALEQRSIDTQNTLDTIGQLLVHPGRKAGTGASSFLGNVPGTDARGFQAQLETFKAKTFLPMVSALKGMGALSDAEGKKLSAAVGALDPAMKEAEFEKELKRVAKFLYEKARAAGLNVVMPELPGVAPSNTQGGASRSNW